MTTGFRLLIENINLVRVCPSTLDVSQQIIEGPKYIAFLVKEKGTNYFDYIVTHFTYQIMHGIITPSYEMCLGKPMHN